METKTLQRKAMDVVTNQYDWHTKLFKNVLVNVTDSHAQNRLDTKANHIAWLAGSLVNARYELGNLLGVPLKQTSHELFKDYKGIQDGVTYPSLDEFRSDWELISPALREALVSVTEEQLNGPDPFEMPGGPYTFFDTLIGCTDRESYCIGQIGLWRRLLGYDAMKYM